ncbi:hypothetical protein GUJ93_ZPchr0001g31879 [Zizania palustris]|uniref:Uncharacterized protein n=1 Tax=Zizania palustris TaxID=103762 RepID=A0A8J5RR57_ZIZPA|nr:hypothetical protein GUJ93_ZPchr0001g31879 [Zizania palustris]
MDGSDDEPCRQSKEAEKKNKGVQEASHAVKRRRESRESKQRWRNWENRLRIQSPIPRLTPLFSPTQHVSKIQTGGEEPLTRSDTRRPRTRFDAHRPRTRRKGRRSATTWAASRRGRGEREGNQTGTWKRLPPSVAWEFRAKLDWWVGEKEKENVAVALRTLQPPGQQDPNSNPPFPSLAVLRAPPRLRRQRRDESSPPLPLPFCSSSFRSREDISRSRRDYVESSCVL